MGGASRVISSHAAAQGDRIGSRESVQQLQTRVYTEAQNVQKAKAIEEIQRVIKEEVKNDWIERWEERWRRKMDRHAKGEVGDGVWKCTKLETETVKGEGRDAGADADDAADADVDADADGGEGREGEWDWPGAEREQCGGAVGEDHEREVWLHRRDDSDLLLATDVYLTSAMRCSPLPPRSSLSPAAQPGDPGSAASPEQGWGGVTGFVSNTSATSYYPSSSTISAALTVHNAILSAPASPLPLPAVVVGQHRIASLGSSTTPSLLAQGEQNLREPNPQIDSGAVPEGNLGLECWMKRRDAWTGADKEGRVRVGRSKFVDNPLTASINEAAYPTIYNKCIKKALAPVIPINLKHITNALVAGWKMDDEWPPQTQALEPTFSRRRPPRGSGRSGTRAPPAAGDVRGAAPVGTILGML